MSTDRIDALHAELESGVAALIDSETWQSWLATAAKFHTYSFNNQMLIAVQCPAATHVAGYRAWQALGRNVRKGEHSIGILAPNTRRVKDAITGEESRRVTGFRVASVFDISQTDGDPLPVEPRPVLLQGEAPAGLWDALTALAVREGFTVERGDTGQANGWMQPDTRTIRVSDTLSPAQAAKTLVHECAHALLHAATDYDYSGHRGIAEVEAESVAFIVGSVHELDTGAYSMPYVAGWGKDAAVVAATASNVTRTARAILAATNPQ
jgi:antirestriction protein ArdC